MSVYQTIFLLLPAQTMAIVYLALRIGLNNVLRLDFSFGLLSGMCYAGMIIIWAVYRILIYPFFLSPLRHLPEPINTGLLWAHADQIRKLPNSVPYRDWIHSVANNGMIRYRVLFNEERILLTSTAALRDVLVTRSYEFVKPAQAGFIFTSLLGNGLLVSEGDDHKRQRKALMPGFAYRHIKDLYSVFWAKALESTDAIATAINAPCPKGSKPSQIQNTYDWASRVTLDIIGLAGMGYDFNSIWEPHGKLYTTYHKLFTNEPPLFRWINIGVYIPLEFLFGFPIPTFDGLRASAREVREVAHDLINKKRRLAAEGKHMGYDILSIAIGSGAFTDDELADQVMTFLAAGHETTASALTWAAYLLARHPKVQFKLREEVRNNLTVNGKLQSSVEPSELDKLPYLNAVCNEVLRFLPSVPLTLREPVRDITVQGQPIPKGTIITISAWAINASKELWGEDALEFNPDRWIARGKSSNSGGAQNNFANLTFLHGPRSCIGKDFARSEFLCLTAAWFSRFEVELERPGVGDKAVGWVTTRPSDRLPVRFSKVER